MRYFGLLSATLLAVPAAAPSQVTVVDEGSFTISRSGTKIGRETFTIRRTPGPGGDVYVANATVEFDAERLAPALRADDSFAPLAYQLEVRSGGEVRERLRAIVGRGRISAQVKTAKGESTKEYIVADGALVLDDNVFHQYYFLARRASSSGSGTVPVVVPQRNAQVVMRVSTQGNDAVTIGGRGVAARVLVLTEPGGATRHIWVDDQGRVLKVVLDAREITALRDEPPR
ncbi:MAG TPA: hypothetical protein VFK04_01800 [Gemmatimonadaceae bacterium]|jgi:hypothetical protein|nr:hypothetical protein [Gemmatimonadaceae bacterium]